MALVLVVTVFVDLITAVGLGVFLAALAFVRSIAQQQLDAINRNAPVALNEEEQTLFERAGSRLQMFEFSGPLSFGAAADLSHRVRENVHGREAVILDFGGIDSVDVSAARAVEAISEDAHDEERLLFVCNVTETVHQQLAGLNADRFLPEGYQSMSRLEAIRKAVAGIEASDTDAEASDATDPSLKPA